MQIKKPAQLALYIDSTLLKAGAIKKEIKALCKEAARYGFKSVCVNPCWVEYCAGSLKNSPVKVCTVIGFPLGASTIRTKVFEAREAVKNGADELDAVINIGKARSKEYGYILKETRALRKVSRGRILKLILETSLLKKNEIVKLCSLARKCGADFVKTSTGYGPSGAKAGDVRLMKKIVGASMGVKASGGIKTFADALKMIKSGADRIGTSSAVNIIKGKYQDGGANISN